MTVLLLIPAEEVAAPTSWNPLESGVVRGLREGHRAAGLVGPDGAFVARTCDRAVVAAAESLEEAISFLRFCRLAELRRLAAATEIQEDKKRLGRQADRLASHGDAPEFSCAAGAEPLPPVASANPKRHPFASLDRHLERRPKSCSGFRGLHLEGRAAEGAWIVSDIRPRSGIRISEGGAGMSAHEKLERSVWLDETKQMLAEAMERILPARKSFSSRLRISCPVLGAAQPAATWEPFEGVCVRVAEGKGLNVNLRLLRGLERLEEALPPSIFRAGESSDPLWELPAFLGGGLLRSPWAEDPWFLGEDGKPTEEGKLGRSLSRVLRARRPTEAEALSDLSGQAVFMAFAAKGRGGLEDLFLSGLRRVEGEGRTESALGRAVAAAKRSTRDA